jgi:hypothetical protein
MYAVATVDSPLLSNTVTAVPKFQLTAKQTHKTEKNVLMLEVITFDNMNAGHTKGNALT